MKRTGKKPASQIDPQGKAFIKVARDLGCDEDEAAFEDRLRKIAKTTPPKSEALKPAVKRHKTR
jgi:hypothetical protein